MRTIPTAPVAAGALIAGYAVASSSGSRPLGGLVLAAGAAWCVRAWDRRNGRATALALASVGTGAFVLSHVLAPQIGAWPAVLTVAGATALAAGVLSDRAQAATA